MKLIWIVLGIILCSITLFFLIIYLNLFTLGYTFVNFGKFIIRKIWFWFLPIGILLIYKGLKGKKNNELLLRHRFKFFRRKHTIL